MAAVGLVDKALLEEKLLRQTFSAELLQSILDLGRVELVVVPPVSVKQVLLFLRCLRDSRIVRVLSLFKERDNKVRIHADITSPIILPELILYFPGVIEVTKAGEDSLKRYLVTLGDSSLL
jgi:hypothetical protein